MIEARLSNARRNVISLFVCQALTQSAIVLAMTVGAMAGYRLAADKAMAMLPVALSVVGTAIVSVPAAMLMRRHGRRKVFVLGAIAGISGSAVCVFALNAASFLLFVTGYLFFGVYQGIASYYRFAAAEVAGPTNESRAISLVVTGGLVAAFVGPWLAIEGRDLLPDRLFIGSYVLQSALSAAALVLLARLALPPVATVRGMPARPLAVIMAAPAVRAAVLSAATGFAVMVMLMSAAPLAMLGCGLSGSNIASVIQWHVVAMFAPSFFAGRMIERWGAPRIVLFGFALLLLQACVAVSGLAFGHFLGALLILGLGWNWTYIGASALLTSACEPADRFKAQAFNELCVFGSVALATFVAGWIHDRLGWQTLNVVAATMVLAAMGFLALFARGAARLSRVSSGDC